MNQVLVRVPKHVNVTTVRRTSASSHSVDCSCRAEPLFTDIPTFAMAHGLACMHRCQEEN